MAVLAAAMLSFVSIPLFGHLSDRFGRKRVYMLGAALTGIYGFAYFAMLDTRVPGLVVLAIVLSLVPHDMMYGPQAALIAESFTATPPIQRRVAGLSTVVPDCGRSRSAHRVLVDEPLSLAYADRHLHSRLRDHFAACDRDAQGQHQPGHFRPLTRRLIQRIRINVFGAVQGVGFRPFVCRLARELGLTGQVSNNPSGAMVEVEGREAALAEFATRLERDRPKPCLILAKETTQLDPAGYPSFEIVIQSRRVVQDRGRVARSRHLSGMSRRDSRPRRAAIWISLHQLHELRAALHHHPRDPLRPAKYDDGVVRHVPGVSRRIRDHRRPPLSRAAHRLSALWSKAGIRAVEQIATWLRNGEIVALKGIGGFQLLCDARNRNRGANSA